MCFENSHRFVSGKRQMTVPSVAMMERDSESFESRFFDLECAPFPESISSFIFELLSTPIR